MKKLFIGKLSFSTTEASLRTFFAAYEPLKSVAVVKDKFNGDSRGFGFIEIEDGQKADDAIQALNGAVLDGRAIVVNEARPSTDGPRSGGQGGGFGGPNRGARKGGYGQSSNSRY